MYLENQAPTLLCREVPPRWEAAKEHPRLPSVTELPGRLRKAKCLDKTSVRPQQPEPRPVTPSPDLAATPGDAAAVAKAFSLLGVRVEPVPLPRVPTGGVSGSAAQCQTSIFGRCLLKLPVPAALLLLGKAGRKQRAGRAG